MHSQFIECGLESAWLPSNNIRKQGTRHENELCEICVRGYFEDLWKRAFATIDLVHKVHTLFRLVLNSRVPRSYPQKFRIFLVQAIGQVARIRIARSLVTHHLSCLACVRRIRHQARTLHNDKLFCVFLAGSGASFAVLAGRELARLTKQRVQQKEQRSKVERAKGQSGDGVSPAAARRKRSQKVCAARSPPPLAFQAPSHTSRAACGVAEPSYVQSRYTK